MGKNSKSPVELHAPMLEDWGGGAMTIERAAKVISEELVLDEASGLPFGGIYRGPAGFVELLGKVPLDFRLDLMLTDGEENIMFQGEVFGETPGGFLRMPMMERWRFENDKCVELVVCYHDTKLVHDMFNA